MKASLNVDVFLLALYSKTSQESLRNDGMKEMTSFCRLDMRVSMQLEKENSLSFLPDSLESLQVHSVHSVTVILFLDISVYGRIFFEFNM